MRNVMQTSSSHPKVGMEPVRLVTYAAGADASVGLATDRGVVDVAGLVPGAATQQTTLTALIDGFDELRPSIESLLADGPALAWVSVAVCPAVPVPGKLLCIMDNRPALARAARPWAYLKCAVSAIGGGQMLRLPAGETELWYKPELAV